MGEEDEWSIPSDQNGSSECCWWKLIKVFGLLEGIMRNFLEERIEISPEEATLEVSMPHAQESVLCHQDSKQNMTIAYDAGTFHPVILGPMIGWPLVPVPQRRVSPRTMV